MTINAHMHKKEQSFKGCKFSCVRMSFDREIIGGARWGVQGF